MIDRCTSTTDYGLQKWRTKVKLWIFIFKILFQGQHTTTLKLLIRNIAFISPCCILRWSEVLYSRDYVNNSLGVFAFGFHFAFPIIIEVMPVVPWVTLRGVVQVKQNKSVWHWRLRTALSKLRAAVDYAYKKSWI